MSELTDLADAILRRAERMTTTMASLERHLLREQADAIAGPPEHADAPRKHHVNPDSDAYALPGTDQIDVDLGHSDPVPQAAARIGQFRRLRINLVDSMAGINRSLDHAERVCTATLAVSPGAVYVDDEPRCPGWTVELQARLGGCGNVLESYTRDDKTTGARSLCAGCRKAEGRARRAEQADGLGEAS